MTAGMRSRLRKILLIVIGLLYLVSIPWYRETGAVPMIVLGLPSWVAVAVVCYLGVAVLGAVSWLLTEVKDSDADRESP